MNLEELKSILESTGLPVTYRAWSEDPDEPPPPLPWICYLTEESEPLFADGQVYYSYDSVAVELYTRFKEQATERMVETALAGFHWKKSQEYLSTERCYITIYEIEV